MIASRFQEILHEQILDIRLIIASDSRWSLQTSHPLVDFHLANCSADVGSVSVPIVYFSRSMLALQDLQVGWIWVPKARIILWLLKHIIYKLICRCNPSLLDENTIYRELLQRQAPARILSPLDLCIQPSRFTAYSWFMRGSKKVNIVNFCGYAYRISQSRGMVSCDNSGGW